MQVKGRCPIGRGIPWDFRRMTFPDSSQTLTARESGRRHVVFPQLSRCAPRLQSRQNTPTNGGPEQAEAQSCPNAREDVIAQDSCRRTKCDGSGDESEPIPRYRVSDSHYSCLRISRSDRELFIRGFMISFKQVPLIGLSCHKAGKLSQVAP